MKALAMFSMALLITSCMAADDSASKKDQDGIWELTLKLGDDFDDPQPADPTTPTKEVATEKVPHQPVEDKKKVEVKVPYPVEVIKEVPVVVEKRVAVIVERKVPYPVVQKEYVKVPYPVFVKKPVYIEKHESHAGYDYNYRQKQWRGC